MTVHRLDPAPGNVVDVFAPSQSPVLELQPGDTVVVRSLDASGCLQPHRHPGDRPATMFASSRGHCLTGPIAVAGAEPGRTLAIHLQAMRPDNWGWTVAGGNDTPLNRRLGLLDTEPSWLLWSLDPDAGTGIDQSGRQVRLAPFLGVLGVPPPEAGEHSTIPPRAVGGGNIDCRSLVAGTTLYLPVTVPGGLLSIGDGHAAQGDGEVSGTAIECPMTTTLSIDLVDTVPTPGIHADTPSGRVTFGFSADLNEAMFDALQAMIGWMGLIFDVDAGTAAALASTAVDLRITQVVNRMWGVHAVLAHDAIR